VNFVVAYITVTGGPKTEEYATRFCETFEKFPPAYPFKLSVLCNGGPPAWSVGALFANFTPQFHARTNEGADIGAYIDLAKHLDGQSETALVCFGETVYFHRRGWLKRIAQAWSLFGEGMYGFYASNLVRKHLNTTAFVISPKLLASWPEPVKQRESRLLFEHGPLPMWKRVEQLGNPVKLITWSGIYDSWDWRGHQNEFWRGDQSEVLVKSIHTDRYDDANESTKRRWQQNADRGLT